MKKTREELNQIRKGLVKLNSDHFKLKTVWKNVLEKPRNKATSTAADVDNDDDLWMLVSSLFLLEKRNFSRPQKIFS